MVEKTVLNRTATTEKLNTTEEKKLKVKHIEETERLKQSERLEQGERLKAWRMQYESLILAGRLKQAKELLKGTKYIVVIDSVKFPEAYNDS